MLLDSKTIADYLLTHHAPRAANGSALPLQPTLFHPAHRYEDENVLTLIDAALDSGIQIFVFARDGITEDAAPYLRRQAERVVKCLSAVDKIYAGRASLHDDAFGYIDIAVASSIDWFRFRQVGDWSAHANLASFLEQNRDRVSLVKTDPRLAM